MLKIALKFPKIGSLGSQLDFQGSQDPYIPYTAYSAPQSTFPWSPTFRFNGLIWPFMAL